VPSKIEDQVSAQLDKIRVASEAILALVREREVTDDRRDSGDGDR
jgi:hypothetical protein